MKLGFIGLGKMGSRMVEKLTTDHQVVVYNRTETVTDELISRVSASKAVSIEDLISKLDTPKIIWLMLPAGEPTQLTISSLSNLLEAGDIIIDGSNSHYLESEKNYQQLDKLGIGYLGIGVSGGIIAPVTGYPLMIGGHQSSYVIIKPILDTLTAPHGGYEYFGTGGAGHFVKMIHNGIEYGIMQSLAEGFAVLNKSPYSFDLQQIAKLWQKGTLVSGFMLDRTVEALDPDPTLATINGVIAESGEARWTIEAAENFGVPVDIIKASLDYRKRSQSDIAVSSSFTAKLVAALRHAFGGHALSKKD